MSILSNLNPQSLWMYFEEICNIPRLSRNEEKIRKYLLDFGVTNGFECKEDATGNILIVKPASAGMENRKTVVLQSHMDMVGEKNHGSKHNWSTDPVIPVIKDGWVAARETTLGADDGIGVASQLAILADKNLKAGKIECLFTVDEESGMTGAINLKSDFFTGKTLINLDSEDEGILFIGCAGGLETVGTITFNTIPADDKKGAFDISVSGLHGGHSGDEIHKGYGNAIKIMTRILLEVSEFYDISVSSFNGGNLRNAIPREATSKIGFRPKDSDGITGIVTNLNAAIRQEFGDLEKDLIITVKKTEPVPELMQKGDQEKLLSALSCCPHGALAWSEEMDDLVETSTNLASVKFTGNNTVRIITTQRSSIETSKFEAASKVDSCMKIADAKVTKSNSYPGWKPDLNSEILKLTRNSYLRLFAKEPQIRAIHAGLECGLIYEKIRGIDMISFGPTIRGAHTTEEKIEIKTAQMFWNLLTDVVSNMPLEMPIRKG